MIVQKTDWGYIEWLHLGTDVPNKQSMRVGITALLPGMRQNKHIHYGHDQFLYVLEGQGLYFINDETYSFESGMYFYIKEGSTHDTLNTGTIPVRELLITNPTYFETDIKIDDSNMKTLNLKNILYDAVEAIRVQFLESLSLPFTIFDESWSIVVQSSVFPSFCTEVCNPKVKLGECDCMMQKYFDGRIYSNENQFVCKHGLVIYHMPIAHRGRSLGSIRGGHILLSSVENRKHEGLYDTPTSTVAGIQNLLQQITKSIVSYCEFISSRQELMEKDKMIELTENKRAILENNLNKVKDIVTNLKINHHFLFNTLNAMASMALDGDKYDLYKSIINLSKMFRYTMETELRFVEFRYEVEYLDTYIDLQKLRYGNSLNIKYSIADGCLDFKIPFNFLQPIVENAFIHGFLHSDEDKYIEVIAERSEVFFEITVTNNGNTIDNITLNRVNKNLKNKSGHGLSLIYSKLKSAYGDNFRMKIYSGESEGTYVKIFIPIN